MGMLATVINCLALQDTFERIGLETRVMTAIEMQQFAEPYVRNKAISHLEKGKVVIFGCGIGSPFFSTDTAAVLRAAEIGADIVLLAKNVDGVYTADPKLDPSATKIDSIEYIDILREGLRVLDFTATSFSMENQIPILLFGLDNPNNIIRAVNGEKIGTIVGGTRK
jgi:uridylate kinase